MTFQNLRELTPSECLIGRAKLHFEIAERMREKKSGTVKAKPWARTASGLIALATLYGIFLLYTHEREESDFWGLAFAFASMAFLFGYIAFTGRKPG